MTLVALNAMGQSLLYVPARLSIRKVGGWLVAE